MRRHPERIKTATEKAELSPLAVRCVDGLLVLLVISAILICRVGQSRPHYICPHIFLCHCSARREREDQQTAMSIDPKGCFPIYLLVFPLAVARCHISGRPLHTLGACRLFRALFSDSLCRHAAADGRHAHAHAMRACDAECVCLSVVRLTYCSSLFAHSFFRELISAEVLRTCSMKSSLVSVVLFSIAAASIDGRQRSVAFALPTCDSERPNSWATFRTLSIPNVPEFLGINNDDASSRWARALCCIYTHVEKSDRLSQPQMKTYDGSKYNIRADSFVEAARKAMDDICDMSMGSDDCRRRKQCVDEALTQGSQDIEPNDKVVSTVATACEDDSSFARGNKTCRFISNSNVKRRRRLCRRLRYRMNCPLTCGNCT